eukprot:GHVH01006435.1.p1 GENE.GHVH01006435.1~~GHVH01006435.1.p1  ORF type:complete len:144 (+),score=17.03 GHVH01006435.1:42-434(+)
MSDSPHKSVWNRVAPVEVPQPTVAKPTVATQEVAPQEKELPRNGGSPRRSNNNRKKKSAAKGIDSKSPEEEGWKVVGFQIHNQAAKNQRPTNNKNQTAGDMFRKSMGVKKRGDKDERNAEPAPTTESIEK